MSPEEKFIGFIVRNMQEGALVNLFMLAHHKRNLKRVTGKDSLSQDELFLIRSIMSNCIDSAINDMLFTLSNPCDDLSLKIEVDGKHINDESIDLQSLAQMQDWMKRYGDTSHLNDSNYLDPQ